MKRKVYATDVNLDESIPGEQIAAILSRTSVEVDSFNEWLGREVGWARYWAAYKPPSRSETIAALKAFRDTMQAAQHFLSAGGLPPKADADMGLEFLRLRGRSIPEFGEDMRPELMTLVALANRTITEYQRQTQSRGTKKKNSRTALLSDVATRLEASGEKALSARKMAGEILTACGIAGLPQQKPTLLRAVKRIAPNSKKKPAN